MEEIKTPEVIETPEEKINTFTQADVSNIVAKNVKEEKAKLLKELGIENVDDLGKTKEALKAYKELQDQQKSDLEKLSEVKGTLEQENATLKAQLKAIEDEKKLNKVLGDMQIESTYHKAIAKLIPTLPEDDKELKELITSTIKEFLPNVLESKDVGFEKKPEKKPISGQGQYLNEKYKNNPFFKG